ncbi:unnamed protein product [Sphenostylis stenocarpa]|uniref:Uncharacterized protein n=1 Tax=Sphenostylis stenocarpa TaxID=92480 RepID=A0AA86STS5_9FABA|nr:unnamed protein product [Sphenostylis stenocarpa]
MVKEGGVTKVDVWRRGVVLMRSTGLVVEFTVVGESVGLKMRGGGIWDSLSEEQLPRGKRWLPRHHCVFSFKEVCYAKGQRLTFLKEFPEKFYLKLSSDVIPSPPILMLSGGMKI